MFVPKKDLWLYSCIIGRTLEIFMCSGQHSCPRVNKYSCLTGTLSKQNMYCGKSGRWYIGYGRGGWKLVISDGRGIAT